MSALSDFSIDELNSALGQLKIMLNSGELEDISASQFEWVSDILYYASKQNYQFVSERAINFIWKMIGGCK